MFHSLPHFLTPTQTSPPERTAPDSLRREASQAPLAWLLRCATALSNPGACAMPGLRVTAPLGCGSDSWYGRKLPFGASAPKHE